MLALAKLTAVVQSICDCNHPKSYFSLLVFVVVSVSGVYCVFVLPSV